MPLFRHRIIPVTLIALFFATGGCSSFLESIHIGQKKRKDRGAVHFSMDIPQNCNETRGIKQKKVIKADSMEQLERHYRLTFHVWFQDGISPELYGTLYYQNRQENKYCMALPDGQFAVFSDSRVGRKPNISHEVCYPIKDCLNNPGFLSAAPERESYEQRNP